LVPIEVHYMEKNPGIFSSKTLISFRLKNEWHGYLGWHDGVSKLSAKVFFFKVNYSFKMEFKEVHISK